MLYDKKWDTPSLFKLTADVIRERGWCQHALVNEKGQVCLAGAMNVVLAGHPVSVAASKSPEWDTLTRRLRKEPKARRLAYGGDIIIAWNNHPDRTVEEVLAVLDELAVAEVVAPS